MNNGKELGPPLLGKDIAWKAIVGFALLVKYFTPLAEIEKGKVVNDAKFSPYALLEVECPEFKTPEKGMQLPVVHKVDFAHLWELYRGRGVADDEEVIVGYTPPETTWLKIFGKTIPHLRILVSPRGNLDKVLNGKELPSIIAEWHPIKGRVK